MKVYLLSVLDEESTFFLGVYRTCERAERHVQTLVNKSHWEIDEILSAPTHKIFFIKDESISYEIAELEVKN